MALLEPVTLLREREAEGDYTARLALLEDLKTFPHAAVWDYYCASQGVPIGHEWLAKIRAYERDVMLRRDREGS